MQTAHKSPTLTVDGVNYRLERYGSGLRLRSRSVHHPVSYATGTFNVTLAKRKAREWLADRKAGKPVATTKTLEDVVACYRSMAKRAGKMTEDYNVRSLRLIVRDVLGRELRKVHLHEVGPALWSRYQAMRQGGERVDLSTRRPEHVTINTTVRAACSIFIAKLRPQYAAAGLNVPADAGAVQWLQQVKRNPAEFDEAAMQAAWAGLDDRPLWFVIALARFAGLRKKEIGHVRGGWLVQREGVWCIEVRDRPEEEFYTKTGAHYFAMVTSGALIEALRSLGRDELAVSGTMKNRANWIERGPHQWLRAFMGGDIAKPLHRLRAAYLNSVRQSALIEMQTKAVEQAAQAAGHTSTGTTTKHYLPAQLSA